MDAPRATPQPKLITQFGNARKDEYAWLRDPQWQKVMIDPSLLQDSIRDYLLSENQYTEHQMADNKDFQTELYDEMKSRIAEDDSSVPQQDGEYAYFYQYYKGAQHPQYLRKRDHEEQLIFDPNLEARQHEYFSISHCEHSPDHRWLAYSVDIHGSEFYQIHIIEIETGKSIMPPIEHTQGDFVWSANSESLFYTSLDDNHRPEKVWLQMVSQIHSEPPRLIYTESDNGFFVSLEQTESRRFIVINAHDHITSEVHLIDANNPKQPPRLVHTRETGLEYYLSDNERQLFILTNANHQHDYKIMTCPLESTDRCNWKDYYVPAAGVLLESILMFKHYLVRLERSDGLPMITIENLDNKSCEVIEFQEQAFELGLIPGYEFATTTLRFSYTSMTTPTEVYDLQMDTGERTLRKQQQIPSGHNPHEYVTERIQITAEDGAMVPVSLLYHQNSPPDCDNPLLLYGYGAYGHSIPAAFSATRLSLVKRGFTFALAHIRGGMEKGYHWYQQGKLENKPNTFKDFIACANYLIDKNYTSKGNIAIHGASAGGLLIGAAINTHPDLFRCAIADVPFVDVLNTMSDETLPLTPAEWPEWGNPIRYKHAYESIADYCPYENVRAQDYPAMLVTAGLTDPRVTYWEPAKWVARLRALKTDQNMLCLKTNMSAGHAGASGRFAQLHETALMYGFILKQFNLASIN